MVACQPRVVFRLTMSRWQIHNSWVVRRTAGTHSRGAVAFPNSPDAAARVARFPYFPISSIDAPRSVSGGPDRSPWRVLVSGERVYHGQQNDHRRVTPGGNPGGGAARQ